MAIELITGVGADNHISSNDFRAFNRANFGQGKYILKDAENMEWFVSASAGEIYINSGSLMWSGMHIRNASDLTLKYIVPTTSSTVYIYLHYTKDTSTTVENVEFVVSVGKELTPIVDNLADNTIEAYTLFGSFTASSSASSNFVNGFSQAKNLEDVEKLVANAHSETVLFEGIASINSTINLSESLRNFYEIEIVCDSSDSLLPNVSGRRLTAQLPAISESFDMPMFGAGKWSNTNDTFLKVVTARFSITDDTKLEYTNGQFIIIGNAILEQDPLPIRKIIGIGRKN